MCEALRDSSFPFQFSYVSDFELDFIPYDYIFAPPKVGSLSPQEFPHRVSLSLLYYYTILETFFDLQKHRYNRMFWDQHKFLIYV